MGGNRVEELESTVTELQATIDGLTDELLECKERIEALEEEVDPDMDIIEGGITTGASSSSSANGGVEGSESGAGAGESADSDNTDGDEAGDDSDANDIIVA